MTAFELGTDLLSQSHKQITCINKAFVLVKTSHIIYNNHCDCFSSKMSSIKMTTLLTAPIFHSIGRGTLNPQDNH